MKIKIITTGQAFIFGFGWEKQRFTNRFRADIILGFIVICFYWENKTCL